MDTFGFVGRVEELATLREWVLEERCRLVAVLGVGGKTSLTARVAQDVAPLFERVYWRCPLVLDNSETLFEVGVDRRYRTRMEGYGLVLQAVGESTQHVLQGHAGALRGVAVSHDGERVASGGYDGTVSEAGRRAMVCWAPPTGSDRLSQVSDRMRGTGVLSARRPNPRQPPQRLS